jgi:phenylalanyl-tRNA synthetase alpha subunit
MVKERGVDPEAVAARLPGKLVELLASPRLTDIPENPVGRVLPLLLTARFEGQPIRVWSSGKVHRVCEADAKHLEVFHQLEVLWLDDRAKVDQWRLTSRVLQSVDRIGPGRPVKIVPVQYPMCERACELEVEENGEWLEVLARGVFTGQVVTHLGGDPARHVAMGVGYGLERLAMLRYGIDDIRKVDVARVA